MFRGYMENTFHSPQVSISYVFRISFSKPLTYSNCTSKRSPLPCLSSGPNIHTPPSSSQLMNPNESSLIVMTCPPSFFLPNRPPAIYPHHSCISVREALRAHCPQPRGLKCSLSRCVRMTFRSADEISRKAAMQEQDIASRVEHTDRHRGWKKFLR